MTTSLRSEQVPFGTGIGMRPLSLAVMLADEDSPKNQHALKHAKSMLQWLLNRNSGGKAEHGISTDDLKVLVSTFGDGLTFSSCVQFATPNGAEHQILVMHLDGLPAASVSSIASKNFTRSHSDIHSAGKTFRVTSALIKARLERELVEIDKREAEMSKVYDPRCYYDKSYIAGAYLLAEVESFEGGFIRFDNAAASPDDFARIVERCPTYYISPRGEAVLVESVDGWAMAVPGSDAGHKCSIVTSEGSMVVDPRRILISVLDTNEPLSGNYPKAIEGIQGHIKATPAWSVKTVYDEGVGPGEFELMLQVRLPGTLLPTLGSIRGYIPRKPEEKAAWKAKIKQLTSQESSGYFSRQSDALEGLDLNWNSLMVAGKKVHG